MNVVLVICLDNLFDENSKFVFKYFQEIWQNAFLQLLILFLAKRENSSKYQIYFDFLPINFLILICAHTGIGKGTFINEIMN